MRRLSRKRPEQLAVIGWREWVRLPDLHVDRIKAKVDTGARSSALHAWDVAEFSRHGQRWVKFNLHPVQRNNRISVAAEARILEYRSVRSSSGRVTHRPVIVTPVEMMGQRWLVELTLANRDAMGFRMLLGRQAIRQRFLVDSGASFYGGQPKKKTKKRKDH
jgi:hypothetical protein